MRRRERLVSGPGGAEQRLGTRPRPPRRRVWAWLALTVSVGAGYTFPSRQAGCAPACRHFHEGASPETQEPFRPMATINQLRSEEHTSELQSRENLVCRLLL